MDETCVCWHSLHRHDMGHGCIECRCRGFRERTVTPGVQRAREQFCEAIRGYSEDRWCAQWMRGVVDGIRREGGIWLVHAAKSQGWPIGLDGEDGWEPLSDDDTESLIDYVHDLIP